MMECCNAIKTAQYHKLFLLHVYFKPDFQTFHTSIKIGQLPNSGSNSGEVMGNVLLPVRCLLTKLYCTEPAPFPQTHNSPGGLIGVLGKAMGNHRVTLTTGLLEMTFGRASTPPSYPADNCMWDENQRLINDSG